MGITVREAMRIGGLVRCKVVAGEGGLDRVIDSITVMEVPDVIRWLKGNVLLLSSLYPIKDDTEAINQLVQQLNEVNSAALAIKTRQYVQEIPKAIIEAGNRIQLPIIEIASEVSYLEIMTPLMELIVRKADPGKEQLESYFQWITELAMGGKGITALIDAVEQVTLNQITVGSELCSMDLNKGMEVSPLTRVQKNELITAKRPIRMVRSLNHTLVPCMVTPLILNEELAGDYTCWHTRREFQEQDLWILERTRVLIAMEFLKIMTKTEVEQTYKDHLLAEVLLGQVQDQLAALEQATRFGWDLSKSYDVLCIAVNPANESKVQSSENETVRFQEPSVRLLSKVQSFFRFEEDKAIVTFLKGNIIILSNQGNSPHTQNYSGFQGNVRRLAEAVQQYLSDAYERMSFFVGMGRGYPGFDGIQQGYSEALRAIQLGKPIAVKGCMHYEDLGVFRILSPFHNREELESLYEGTIGKLVKHDTNHHGNLVTTLIEYFTNDGSITDTAGKLFIHVNTLKYRLQKIEQLTDCNVHDSEKRLLLHMGLKIHQMLESEG
ncbi:purine catabolism regulatory protein [Paenibacillus sp. 1_12]|uniref:PucR family transcriptional regulator n=1 Tax=Paenibacillus sp. 1_12 TaxID=1566278 RepID=UPI0008E141D2|nr:PucR family transcriptional regulator [Paenibacillus sp. 1_12]SFL68450.1 purine catabolism regulatory protein [Paenibacillus sp. 1_12]